MAAAPALAASLRAFTSSASSESSTSSTDLPVSASGRCSGIPFSLTLVQPPWMSGSPHGVRGGTYGRAGDAAAAAGFAACWASGVVAATKKIAVPTRPAASHCFMSTLQNDQRFTTRSMKSISSRDTLVSGVPTESSCDEWLCPRLCR